MFVLSIKKRGGQKLTYEKCFYRKKQSGKYIGDIYGFPLVRGWCKDRLKTNPLDTITKTNIRESILQNANERETDGGNIRLSGDCAYGENSLVYGGVKNRPFSKSSLAQGANINIVQYLGIAADETERIARHTKPGIILPLVEIGWDEAYCRKWCEENDLLSPIYTQAPRGGCWFCHNQRIDQLRLLRKDYPELWSLLLKWDCDSPTTFKPDGHTVHDFEKRFAAEDRGVVKAGDKKFRWKQVLENE